MYDILEPYRTLVKVMDSVIFMWSRDGCVGVAHVTDTCRFLCGPGMDVLVLHMLQMHVDTCIVYTSTKI